jgi:hypothetical protein
MKTSRLIAIYMLSVFAGIALAAWVANQFLGISYPVALCGACLVACVASTIVWKLILRGETK